MKNEELYLRIRKRRTNKKSRDIIPYLNYLQKTRRSVRLLKQIENNIKDKGSLKEALIQFIISDVTAFEVYFKDLFHASILFCSDEREILSKCGKLSDKKFDFEDLVIILFDDIELSDIILEQQNFQSLGSIEKVFSILLKENFLKSLEGREFRVKGEDDEDDELLSFHLNDNWYVKLDEYLKLRHDLTHDYNPKLKLNKEKIWDLHNCLVDFILAVDIVFQEEIFEPNVINPQKKRK